MRSMKISPNGRSIGLALQVLTGAQLFSARDSRRLLEAHVDRKGLPSAAELAELRPAYCAAGSLKRLPRSLWHRLFRACTHGAHAKSVAELLLKPNCSRGPLHPDEHAAACTVCEGCIEWAPSARPTAEQLVARVAEAVLSIAKVPASEPVWVHEAWHRCKNETKQLKQLSAETAGRSTPGTPAVTISTPRSPASVTAAYSPAKRVIVAQPCTPKSISYPNSPSMHSPMLGLTPPVEASINGRSSLHAATGRLLLAASALATASADSESARDRVGRTLEIEKQRRITSDD
jgi:hypothetical protein